MFCYYLFIFNSKTGFDTLSENFQTFIMRIHDISTSESEMKKLLGKMGKCSKETGLVFLIRSKFSLI